MDAPTNTNEKRAGRDAELERFRRVHLQQPEAAAPPECANVATEEIAQHSPDGRPADKQSWNKGMVALGVLLFLLIPLSLAGVVYFAGADALLLGVVYVAIVAFSAFPVWYAGLIRHREEREAADIVRHTLAEVKGQPQA